MRWAFHAAIAAVVFFSAGNVRAQQRSGSDDEIKKLEEQIQRLQDSIKAAESRLKDSRDVSESEVGPSPREKAGKDGDGERRNRFGPGLGGFGGPGGKGPGGKGFSGRGSGAGRPADSGTDAKSPGSANPEKQKFPGSGAYEGGNDVKSLEAELRRLADASKSIAARSAEVEARLKKAKQEEEARRVEQESQKKDERSRRGKGSQAGPGTDVERRLDRIEQVLEEIQKQLRGRR